MWVKDKDSYDFSGAIRALKRGHRIAREGWNGKNQYVELGTDFIYTDSNGREVKAYHEAVGSKALVFVGTSGTQVGWLASQSDMLADDWCVYYDDSKEV